MNNEFSLQLEDHETRLASIETDVGILKTGQASFMERLISIEAQGQERERNRAHENQETRATLSELSRQLSTQNGIQQAKNQLEEARTRKLKRLAIIVGICCTIGSAVGSTLLSDQEIASTIWVKYLHKTEPWDNGK